MKGSMKKFSIDKLALISVPRVVGTVSRKTSFISTQPWRSRECDIVEVRLDMIGAGTRGWLERCMAIEAAGKPVILTLRLAEEGGLWTKPDLDRNPILSQALEQLSCIDVEMTSRLCRPLCRKAEALGKSIIVSWHDFKRTPGRGKLNERVKKILDYPCAIPKIATMVKNLDDVRSLLTLLEADARRPVCIIGMGDIGIRTRVVFPAMGSCLAYGYLDSSVAPGQLSSGELVQFFRQLMPDYRMHPLAPKARRSHVVLFQPADSVRQEAKAFLERSKISGRGVR